MYIESITSLVFVVMFICPVSFSVRLDKVMCGYINIFPGRIMSGREDCDTVTHVCHNPRLVESYPEFYLQRTCANISIKITKNVFQNHLTKQE